MFTRSQPFKRNHFRCHDFRTRRFCAIYRSNFVGTLAGPDSIDDEPHALISFPQSQDRLQNTYVRFTAQDNQIVSIWLQAFRKTWFSTRIEMIFFEPPAKHLSYFRHRATEA